MENPGPIKDQIAKKIKEASNILVTVNSSPTVDQLAATIGLTLLLNKLGKHGTAVFSGTVPSTIEFLEPEKTLEKTTDSLRDFIISLDKSKADKLRYKVEDKLVRIFITPYQTSLSEKDLVFEQGDFNIDVVIALGVKQAQFLDQAIAQHGRILHDATVISLNTDASGDIGTMNWVDNGASSLCEMVASLVELMQDTELLDGQMATALLTGIVAETARFSNSKTTPLTMSVSSKLMTAGANQQLISTKLNSDGSSSPLPPIPPVVVPNSAERNEDGSIVVDHQQNVMTDANTLHTDKGPAEISEHIHINEHGALASVAGPMLPPVSGMNQQNVATPPPTATLTEIEKSVNSLHQNAPQPAPEPPVATTPLPQIESITDIQPAPQPSPEPTVATATPPQPEKLTEIEKSVNSLHQNASEPAVQPPVNTSLVEARKAVSQVLDATPYKVEPIMALNASPIDLGQNHLPDNSTGTMPQMVVDEATGLPNFGLQNNLISTARPVDTTKSPVTDPTSPPPVPPPMMPPTP